MHTIRLFENVDWASTWQVLEPVFRAGETYAFSPDISEAAARRVWIKSPLATFVVVNGSDKVLGTYFLKPNQPALGAHVCNCGYIVSTAARRRGIASAMCIHSQQEAVARGFSAMQYNLVVSTNEGAVRLWLKHGFHIVGTLPEAFNHPCLGLVDAYVMYKLLCSGSSGDDV